MKGLGNGWRFRPHSLELRGFTLAIARLGLLFVFSARVVKSGSKPWGVPWEARGKPRCPEDILMPWGKPKCIMEVSGGPAEESAVQIARAGDRQRRGPQRFGLKDRLYCKMGVVVNTNGIPFWVGEFTTHVRTYFSGD